ncbi:MAG: hypothetical protein OEQ25_10135 [Gammaproteobacteria bacterium]|nr:hypothetical protein [Gammaproteobacteria bacterium]MDH3507484.1 hypothetical protein [Gammaproteobacteria bacterium]
MPETLRRRDRLIFGVLLPIGIMVVGLLIIMNLPTGAGAAEFAALGIMLGAITVAPIVLIVNLIVAFQEIDTPLSCFKRGMVAPGIVLIGAFVYQIGLWDAIT